MQVDMVFAVNMPLQVPDPGQEEHSTAVSSSMSMLWAITRGGGKKAAMSQQEHE